MMTQPNIVPIRDSIATKLLTIVFSIYLLVTITVTLTHMGVEYYYAKSGIIEELNSHQKTFEPALAESLWNLNKTQLNSIIAGMKEISIVVGVKIQTDQWGESGIGTFIDHNGKEISVSNNNSSDVSQTPGNSGLFWHESPITHSNLKGKTTTIGTLTLYSSRDVILQKIKISFLFIIINSIIKTIALWAIFIFVSTPLLRRPLALFTMATQELNLGNLSQFKLDAKTSGKNELKILENAFNAMVRQLFKDSEKINGMTKTFEKFVPRQFLNHLAKEGIEAIRLGYNKASERMTILFCDIRSFTSLSESMTPEEVFNFLNSYLSRMNAPIEKNNGFIDKFIGDAIMALFEMDHSENEAYRAVKAAIEMQEVLTNYNTQRQRQGYQPIDTGIGIHSGRVALGTVGSKLRMDTTVIGDAVNLASRLEGLTKYYNCKIIISSKTFRLLPENVGILWRELDFVRVKGKDFPISIFEIFNADDPVTRDLKQQIIKPYHQALMHFYTRNWDEAISLFSQCLFIYPNDPVTHIHLKRCLDHKQAEPDLSWDGSFQVSHK